MILWHDSTYVFFDQDKNKYYDFGFIICINNKTKTLALESVFSELIKQIFHIYWPWFVNPIVSSVKPLHIYEYLVNEPAPLNVLYFIIKNIFLKKFTFINKIGILISYSDNLFAYFNNLLHSIWEVFQNS